MINVNKSSGNSNYITESSNSSMKLLSTEESPIGYSILSTLKNKTTVVINSPAHQDKIHFITNNIVNK